MESITYLKNLKISPKKLRFYLDAVKGLSPIKAIEQLYYGRQHATKVLYEAVKSAVANAKQTLKTTDDLLNFKLFTVEEGNKLKRARPGSRGSPKPIKRRMSHIKIIITAKDNSKLKIDKVINSEDKVKSEVKTVEVKPEIKKTKKNIKLKVDDKQSPVKK